MPRQFYLPGDYLRRVKRPDQRHVFRQLLLEDAAFWLLLAASGSRLSLRLAAGALLLFFSFWAVYEAGYRDNDACAQRYEADPVLTPQAAAFADRWFEAKACGAAALLGLCGSALLHRGWAPWAAALLALRLGFAGFNRLEKPARPLLYLILQGFRSLALLAVLPVGLAGLLAGLAQACARAAGYALYRARPGAPWPDLKLRLLQLILFAFLTCAFMAAGYRPALWPSLILLAWCGLLARKELGPACRRLRWLPMQNQPSQMPAQPVKSGH